MPRLSTVAALGLLALGVASVAGAPPEIGAALAAETPSPGSAPAAGHVNGSLTLAADDAAFMNRIYRSQTDEVVYCGDVAAGRLDVRLAEMVERGEDYAAFDVSSCSGDGALANVHTHPGGAAALSVADVELLRSPGHHYVCVHHGPIREGAADEGIACYTEDGGEIVGVAVSVGE